MDLERVRDAIRRSKAGEGIVKWHAPHFLQLQPDNRTHVNFFGSPNNVLPKGLGSPAHTHDFGFTSHILSGCIYNTLVDVAPSPRGELVKVDINERGWPCPITFTPTNERMTALRRITTGHLPGAVYDMDPRLYHSTRFDEPTITFLDMWDHAALDYYTVVPPEIASQLKTGANREVPQDKMAAFWSEIDACLSFAGLSSLA